MDLGAIERILRGAAEESSAGSSRGGHAFLPSGRTARAAVDAPQRGLAGSSGAAPGVDRRPVRPPTGLRGGTAASSPRTAFLRSRIAPAVRGAAADDGPASGPTTGSATGPAPAATATRRDPMDLLDAGEPLLTAEELDAFFNPEVAGGDPPAAAEEPAAGPAAGAPVVSPGPDPAEARPAWLKRQVADLADLVQALDMRARSNHAHLAFEGELARLRQFTRTIGFVASPPPRGHQSFDLASFVEEQLGQIAGQSPDAPRLLFRRRGPEGSSGVTADRSLVALALDALLQTAVACSSSGDVVRVSVEGSERGVAARIDFPAGPLAGIHPAEIQRPYALRGVLPEIGPNAIAAAGAIAVGQGGDLTLETVSEGRLAFVLSIA